jgi:hypothetical protein
MYKTILGLSLKNITTELGFLCLIWVAWLLIGEQINLTPPITTHNDKEEHHDRAREETRISREARSTAYFCESGAPVQKRNWGET